MRFAAMLSLAALAWVAASPVVEAAHTAKHAAKPPVARKVPLDADRREPVKRQNFRARTPDEISPWEGFEDCPLGFPCVGVMGNPRWQ